jgi:hypothetical protein
LGQEISRRTFLRGGMGQKPEPGSMNMEHCINHPDRDTRYACLKLNVYMCEECMHCRDPEIYCKFRTACPIHFLTKRKGNLDRDTQTAARTSTGQDTTERPG